MTFHKLEMILGTIGLTVDEKAGEKFVYGVDGIHLVLPNYSKYEQVDKTHINMTRKYLYDSGLMKEEEFNRLAWKTDSLKLVPIDIDTPQDQLAYELATTLAIEGVEDINCVRVATRIMAAFQKGIDSGQIEDITSYLKKQNQH